MTSNQNPYAAPGARVEDAKNPLSTPKGRPIAVWVISLLYGIGAVIGVFSGVAAMLGHPLIIDAVTAELFKQMTIFDHVLGLAGAGIGLTFSISLFRLRRVVCPLVIAMVTFSLFMLAYNVLTKPVYSQVYSQMGWFPVYAGFGIKIAVVTYVFFFLRRKGMLRM